MSYSPLYVLVQRPREEALYIRCLSIDQCITVVTKELDRSPVRTRITMLEKEPDEEPRILKAWRVGARGPVRYHINPIEAEKVRCWYHGGELRGPVRPLYLTSSRAVASLNAGAGPVHAFTIGSGASWLDLSALSFSHPSMDAFGYDDRAIEKAKLKGADVVYDSEDFSRGHPQIFVIDPSVLVQGRCRP